MPRKQQVPKNKPDLTEPLDIESALDDDEEDLKLFQVMIPRKVFDEALKIKKKKGWKWRAVVREMFKAFIRQYGKNK